MAEVVEVSIGGCGADGSSTENAWDAGEESIYDPLYASEFAHLSMADIMELSSSVEVTFKGLIVPYPKCIYLEST